MSSYKHFTHVERICLHRLLKEGKSIREVARLLGRDPSTISREIKRNSSKKGYHHWRAEALARWRRKHQHRTVLEPGSLKYEYVVDRLNRFWSPEEIAMRFRIDYPGEIIGTSTIYRSI